ncbi:MAG: di-heme oxidoredictase family protein [Gallionella sp.]
MKRTLQLTLLLFCHQAMADESAVTTTDATRTAYSQPIPALTAAQRPPFLQGRSLVRQVWVIPPSENREIAGLGPLYNRISCIACHAGNGRGFAPATPQEPMRSMLVRLSIAGENPHGAPNPHPVYGDQLNENGVPSVQGEGRTEIHYTTRRIQLNGGEHVSLRQPHLKFTELGYGAIAPDVMTSPRIAPPIFGLGLLQAVPESAIVAQLSAPKPKGIQGKVNRVWDAVQQKTVLGRFGWKANMPNVHQQIAGAFIGDMGITSPIFPAENCTATQTNCQLAPSAGKPELSAQQLEATAFYHFALAAPQARQPQDKEVQRGARLFQQAQCAACHTPTLTTGEFPALPALAHQTIHPYSDLLLHDMGAALADHRPDFQATGREWRTPPLWGIGLAQKIEPRAGFLHDGRARTLLEAVLWHDGEGRAAAQAVIKMPVSSRRALLTFLKSL